MSLFTSAPQVTSSMRSTQSTTVTHSRGAPKITTTTHGLTPLTHGTHYVSAGAPYMTSTRYTTTSGAPTLLGPTTLMPQQTIITGGSLLGSSHLGMLHPGPLIPQSTLYYPRVTATAPMGLGAQMNISTAHASSASSRMQSSMTINGVHCEGCLALSENAIVEAQNVFVGTAPFTLDQSSLEVTPELCVVTRNPDIKFHLPTLQDGAPLKLAQIKQMAGLDEHAAVYIGLPGQKSMVLFEETDGTLKVNAQQSGTVLGTLRM